jgi:ribonuclease T1
MKIFRNLLVVVVLLVAAYARLVSPPTPGESGTRAYSPVSTDAGVVPSKAKDVLAYVRRTGEAPDGYVGGRRFENREGRLPEGGDYREFDVDPHTGQRNAERIIVDWSTRKAWYTDDHYRTFIPIP